MDLKQLTSDIQHVLVQNFKNPFYVLKVFEIGDTDLYFKCWFSIDKYIDHPPVFLDRISTCPAVLGSVPHAVLSTDPWPVLCGHLPGIKLGLAICKATISTLCFQTQC